MPRSWIQILLLCILGFVVAEYVDELEIVDTSIVGLIPLVDKEMRFFVTPGMTAAEASGNIPVPSFDNDLYIEDEGHAELAYAETNVIYAQIESEMEFDAINAYILGVQLEYSDDEVRQTITPSTNHDTAWFFSKVTKCFQAIQSEAGGLGMICIVNGALSMIYWVDAAQNEKFFYKPINSNATPSGFFHLHFDNESTFTYFVVNSSGAFSFAIAVDGLFHDYSYQAEYLKNECSYFFVADDLDGITCSSNSTWNGSDSSTFIYATFSDDSISLKKISAPPGDTLGAGGADNYQCSIGPSEIYYPDFQMETSRVVNTTRLFPAEVSDPLNLKQVDGKDEFFAQSCEMNRVGDTTLVILRVRSALSSVMITLDEYGNVIFLQAYKQDETPYFYGAASLRYTLEAFEDNGRDGQVFKIQQYLFTEDDGLAAFTGKTTYITCIGPVCDIENQFPSPMNRFRSSIYDVFPVIMFSSSPGDWIPRYTGFLFQASTSIFSTASSTPEFIPTMYEEYWLTDSVYTTLDAEDEADVQDFVSVTYSALLRHTGNFYGFKNPIVYWKEFIPGQYPFATPWTQRFFLGKFYAFFHDDEGAVIVHTSNLGSTDLAVFKVDSPDLIKKSTFGHNMDGALVELRGNDTGNCGTLVGSCFRQSVIVYSNETDKWNDVTDSLLLSMGFKNDDDPKVVDETKIPMPPSVTGKPTGFKFTIFDEYVQAMNFQETDEVDDDGKKIYSSKIHLCTFNGTTSGDCSTVWNIKGPEGHISNPYDHWEKVPLFEFTLDESLGLDDQNLLAFPSVAAQKFYFFRDPCFYAGREFINGEKYSEKGRMFKMVLPNGRTGAGNRTYCWAYYRSDFQSSVNLVLDYSSLLGAVTNGKMHGKWKDSPLLNIDPPQVPISCGPGEVFCATESNAEKYGSCIPSGNACSGIKYNPADPSGIVDNTGSLIPYFSPDFVGADGDDTLYFSWRSTTVGGGNMEVRYANATMPIDPVIDTCGELRDDLTIRKGYAFNLQWETPFIPITTPNPELYPTPLSKPYIKKVDRCNELSGKCLETCNPQDIRVFGDLGFVWVPRIIVPDHSSNPDFVDAAMTYSPREDGLVAIDISYPLGSERYWPNVWIYGETALDDNVGSDFFESPRSMLFRGKKGWVYIINGTVSSDSSEPATLPYTTPENDDVEIECPEDDEECKNGGEIEDEDEIDPIAMFKWTRDEDLVSKIGDLFGFTPFFTGLLLGVIIPFMAFYKTTVQLRARYMKTADIAGIVLISEERKAENAYMDLLGVNEEEMVEDY